MRHFKKVLLSILVLFIFTLHAYAQIEDTTKVYQGKTVTVTADRYPRVTKFHQIAAKMPLTLQQIPASIDVVTQQTLKDQNATVLSDALENVSSVNIQSSLGTQDYFLIRGFESTSAGLVLTDGAREPDQSLFKFYGFGFYDLYNVDQVEVLKGPAAFLYGGNTLSGAVNLARKQPLFHNFADVSLTHSRYQSYRETIEIGYADPDSIFACRVNGVWQSTGNFREHASHKNYAINPAVICNFRKYGWLTVNFEYVRSDIKPDMGIPLYVPNETWQLPDVPRKTSYQTSFDELGYDRFRLRLDYQKDFSESVQLKNKFYFTYLNGSSRFTFANFPYRVLPGIWVFDRNMYSFTETQPYVGNQLDLVLSFKQGKIQHKLLLGFESALFRNNSVEWTTMLKTADLFDPYDPIADFDQLMTLATRIKTHSRNLMLAPYFVDYISFSDKLQLFGGGRVDFIAFHTDRRNAPFDYVGRALTSQPIPFSQTYSKFSPMAGLVLKDSDDLWFYMNYGRSFAQSARIVDEPEKSSQFEIGYKYATLNEKVRTSGAIYSLKKENISIPLTGPLQGDRHASTGSQASLGFEFELTAQPWSDWYVFLTYAFVDAELINYTAMTASQYGKLIVADFSGNQPTFVPSQTINLWITKLFANGFSCGAGIRHVGDQYLNLENTFEIGDYYIASAMAALKIGNYSIQINLDNLSNTKFLSRGLGPYSVIPAGSLVVYGSLDVMF